MKRKLVLATRRSMLALAQARAWASSLLALRGDIEIEEFHVVTTGDKITDRPLQDIGGKGLFLKEIEEALLERRADLAVHSVKDVPGVLPDGLTLAAIPAREDPRDVIVTRSGAGFLELPRGAKVGTSSLRRSVMLKARRPDLTYVPIRGNVDTRLRKCESGEVDAVVLAMAGLKRLGFAARATQALSPDVVLPAVGQGALGIECRAESEDVAAIVRVTHHDETSRCVACERGVLLAVEGSCKIPVAAFAEREGGDMRVRAMLANEDGSSPRFADERVAWPNDDAEAAGIGRAIGDRLRRLAAI